MDLNFVLSQADGRPMYLQIMEQIKWRISSGDWPEGTKLPSIRELAVAARVSVITVKRAYQDLENEGVIVTQQGKGSFVGSIDDSQLRQKTMDDHLIDASSVARSLGWQSDQFGQYAKDLMQQQDSEQDDE